MAKKRATIRTTVKNVSKPTGKKWLLAVDPFADFDMVPWLTLTQRLAANTGAKVVAGYVLAPASFNWTGEFSGPWLNKYKPAAEEKMQELFASTTVQPTVIPCRHAGLRASVQCLSKFAQKIKAEMIVISTHARSGLERLALGSFAESLILTSKVPVLVINPSHPIPSDVRRILVPTDLSRESAKYVKMNAVLAKRLHAAVTLLYKQPDPLDPMIQQGIYTLGGGWVSVQNFISEDVEVKRKQLEKLEQSVRRMGVQVNSVIDSTSEGLVDSINMAAKTQHADMIGVWTHSGAMSAAILGSVARGLVRTAEAPLLVRR
ncbi:MAG: universal stress protein [Bdellovibrionales bacterium]|nr:universal stress protein [Bdellovibrionales bacterium]